MYLAAVRFCEFLLPHFYRTYQTYFNKTDNIYPAQFLCDDLKKKNMDDIFSFKNPNEICRGFFPSDHEG